jgi:hypothetical protein
MIQHFDKPRHAPFPNVGSDDGRETLLNLEEEAPLEAN